MLEDGAHGSLDAGADVVDLAGVALLEQQKVGGDDVAHVSEVAGDVDVADIELRRLLAEADGGDLSREVRNHEILVLAGADVIKRAGHDDFEFAGKAPLAAKRFRGELAHGVRIAWAKNVVLADGEMVGGYESVLLAAADEEEATAESGGIERLQQVERAVKVDVNRGFGIFEGRGNEALRGEMDDVRGRELGNAGAQARPVVEVEEAGVVVER